MTESLSPWDMRPRIVGVHARSNSRRRPIADTPLSHLRGSGQTHPQRLDLLSELDVRRQDGVGLQELTEGSEREVCSGPMIKPADTALLLGASGRILGSSPTAAGRRCLTMVGDPLGPDAAQHPAARRILRANGS